MFKQYLKPEKMLTKEEAIEIAKKAALEQNWPWIEPVNARRSWLSLFRNWDIQTNANKLGTNVHITIEGKTGRIINKGFCPR